MPPGPGEPAPEFSLPGAGGETISLADLRGRKVVLYFYPKDDTSGCTLEARGFEALRAAFAAADTTVVGVSPDGVESHDRFRGKHGLGFPLVADTGRSLIGAYGLWVEKSMYGRRYWGVERTTVLVDRTGRIARMWPKVKVPGHPEEVLEAARALA